MKTVDTKPYCGEEEAQNRCATQQNKKCCGVFLKECVCLRLRLMRVCRGLTQKQVAHDLGLNPITYSGYELGRSEMSYSVLVKVARYFDCTLDSLLFVDEMAGD